MSETQENKSSEYLLEARGLILKAFDDYIISQNKEISEGKTLDFLDIMIDSEDKVFPAFAASLQKLHMKVERKKASKDEEEEVSECDRGDEVSA